jgi:DNA-binding MarR family transcriptional regulator
MNPKNSSPPIPAVAVADQFGRTGKRLALAFDDALAVHGVSTSRARVLMEVAETGPVRLTVVAAAVGIAQGTTSELVEALVREELLSRSPDPSDRRAVLLEATTKGHEHADRWAAAYAAAAEELFGALGEDQRVDFLALLKALEP